ncbi:N-acetyltransferase B complex non catalytic subunit-domain-containing protein [Phellopilus nigrolimitatus]|nr:N-acetyltransferase B complex non catalytic subunit-domain-containing protein [Phellopilus nigrolimitatus]
MTRTTRMAVLGLCRTAINSTSAMIVFVSACQVRQAETRQRKTLPLLGHPQRYARAYDPDEATVLLDSEEGRPIAKMSLAVDQLRRDLHASARAKFVENDTPVSVLVELQSDRKWLEFLAVLDATFAAPAVAEKVRDVRGLFHQLADADGRCDRGALLALLELERRACENEFGSDLKSQHGMSSLIKLYFECFGDKACCFEDLKPYTVLEGSALLALNAYLEGHTHVSDTEPTLCRSINVHELRRHVLGAGELSAAQETECALAYLRAYTTALELCGALPETELQPSDDLILAAQTSVGLWSARRFLEVNFRASIKHE